MSKELVMRAAREMRSADEEDMAEVMHDLLSYFGDYICPLGVKGLTS